jgi:hypothetical protein
MLRQSLRPLLTEGRPLPEEFASKRPEQLTPQQFVTLTKAVCGDKPPEERRDDVAVWRAL